MTVTPDDAGPAAPEFAIPDEDVPDEDVDVLNLAGQRPPAEGAWLWVTTAEGRRGGEFTALSLPRNRPCASGGDVLLRIAPGTSLAVWTVAAGALVPVAAWDLPDDGGWPEWVRAAVMFAMSAMTGLGEHVDLGECDAVDLDAAAGAAVPGLPRSLAPDGRVAAMG